jgi:protein TIF31
MSSEEAAPAAAPAVEKTEDTVAQVEQNGEQEVTEETAEEPKAVSSELIPAEPELIEVPPVTIRVPSPAHGRTLPKRTPAEDYSQFQIYAQNHESIQDLKLTLNEWVGGYWLGPYALRLPRDSSASTEDGGMAKEGQTLSDYLEIQEVFGANDQPRTLEIAKGTSTSTRKRFR